MHGKQVISTRSLLRYSASMGDACSAQNCTAMAKQHSTTKPTQKGSGKESDLEAVGEAQEVPARAWHVGIFVRTLVGASLLRCRHVCVRVRTCSTLIVRHGAAEAKP